MSRLLRLKKAISHTNQVALQRLYNRAICLDTVGQKDERLLRRLKFRSTHMLSMPVTLAHCAKGPDASPDEMPERHIGEMLTEFMLEV